MHKDESQAARGQTPKGDFHYCRAVYVLSPRAALPCFELPTRVRTARLQPDGHVRESQYLLPLFGRVAKPELQLDGDAGGIVLPHGDVGLLMPRRETFKLRRPLEVMLCDYCPVTQFSSKSIIQARFFLYTVRENIESNTRSFWIFSLPDVNNDCPQQ